MSENRKTKAKQIALSDVARAVERASKRGVDKKEIWQRARDLLPQKTKLIAGYKAKIDSPDRVEVKDYLGACIWFTIETKALILETVRTIKQERSKQPPPDPQKIAKRQRKLQMRRLQQHITKMRAIAEYLETQED